MRPELSRGFRIDKLHADADDIARQLHDAGNQCAGAERLADFLGRLARVSELLYRHPCHNTHVRQPRQQGSQVRGDAFADVCVFLLATDRAKGQYCDRRVANRRRPQAPEKHSRQAEDYGDQSREGQPLPHRPRLNLLAAALGRRERRAHFGRAVEALGGIRRQRAFDNPDKVCVQIGPRVSEPDDVPTLVPFSERLREDAITG